MKKFQYLRCAVIAALLAVPVTSSAAGLFANDEENWKRIFGEIKKINARLVALEMDKIKSMQSTQEDVLRQVQEMKSIVPDLRGTVEQNQAEMVTFIKATDTKLKDLESLLKFEVGTNLRLQKEATERLHSDLDASMAEKFDQLKTHLAGDMEKFANTNKQNFQEITRANSESLGKVVEQLTSQNQTLERTNSIFKAELIPAIMKESETSRQLMLTELTKANKQNQEAMLTGFTDAANKNKKMIEVLQKGLQEEQETKTRIGMLAQTLEQANNNVVQTQNTMVKLKDILTGQMQVVASGQESLTAQIDNNVKNTDLINQNLMVADGKVNKLAEGLQAIHTQNTNSVKRVAEMSQGMAQMQSSNQLVGEKVSALIATSKEMAAHSTHIDQSVKALNQSMQGIEGNLAKVDLANEKLSKLVEILKTMAAGQSRVNQVISSQSDMKKAQLDIRSSQLEIKRVQMELKKSQEDLLRKTNVALARTDELKKTLEKIQPPSTAKAPEK
jgi:hypothetical protein